MLKLITNLSYKKTLQSENQPHPTNIHAIHQILYMSVLLMKSQFVFCKDTKTKKLYLKKIEFYEDYCFIGV